ncbi:GNAT family N-acetyltransferase [Crassaminicella thermophila]|uniref:GNAT family N-acetyltransferase n=1 Tax=Crassaminicella thermophila TaxID=2599308 RepID=A0A5C0SD72_CRATE|nr:GNAT family N-acetyltransferase [Crassaminicella thermophila]QEK12191.1 GNAT family N-acetyltransferase [Crassaminicella thermophila]
MLEIKTASYDEIPVIEKFLKENNFNIDQIEKYILNCMIAYDNKIPVAVAGFKQKKNVAIIEFVIVTKNRRREYLGDGIVKALLNVADKKGIEKVYVNTDKSNLFFKKIGFKEVKNYCEYIDDLNMLESNMILQVTLPDYFFKACKSKK